MPRSNSVATESAKTATASTIRSRREAGTRVETTSAIQASRSNSRAKDASTPGRRIFTATVLPSGVTARWTWAIDAAATGLSSNLANRVSTGSSNSRSIARRASAAEKGLSLSWSSARSPAMGAPMISARVASDWPNLTKLGPIRISAVARRRPSLSPSSRRSRNRSRSAAIQANPPRPGSRASGESAAVRTRIQPIRARPRRFRMLRITVGPQRRQPEWIAAMPPDRFRQVIRSKPAAAIRPARAF